MNVKSVLKNNIKKVMALLVAATLCVSAISQSASAASMYVINKDLNTASSTSVLKQAVNASGLANFIDFSQPYSVTPYTDSNYPNIKMMQLYQKRVYSTPLGSYACTYEVELMCAQKSQLISLRNDLSKYASYVSAAGIISTLGGGLTLTNLAALVKIGGCPELAILGLSSLAIGEQYNFMVNEIQATLDNASSLNSDYITCVTGGVYGGGSGFSGSVSFYNANGNVTGTYVAH